MTRLAKGTPWVVGADPGDDEFFAVWTNVPGAANATVAESVGEASHARLIAAAPDLLAAAKLAERYCRAHYAANEVIRTLQDAIKSAEGEHQ